MQDCAVAANEPPRKSPTATPATNFRISLPLPQLHARLVTVGKRHAGRLEGAANLGNGILRHCGAGRLISLDSRKREIGSPGKLGLRPAEQTACATNLS